MKFCFIVNDSVPGAHNDDRSTASPEFNKSSTSSTPFSTTSFVFGLVFFVEIEDARKHCLGMYLRKRFGSIFMKTIAMISLLNNEELYSVFSKYQYVQSKNLRLIYKCQVYEFNLTFIESSTFEIQVFISELTY